MLNTETPRTPIAEFCVEFLRVLGSQSGVSVATYSGGLAVARSFIRQQQQQYSSEKLLS